MPGNGHRAGVLVALKVVTVLHAFGADDRAVALAELARWTDLPKATLHRVARDRVTA